MVETNPQAREVPFDVPTHTTETDVNHQELELAEESRIESLQEQDAEIEEDEIEYANQLALEQEKDLARQEMTQIYEEGQAYSNPSFFKYFVILFPIAILVDIVDILDLTGFLLVLSRSFSIAGTCFVLLVLWFTDSNLKGAHEYTKNLEQRLINIQKRVASGTRLALRTSKVLRKVPGMKGVARAIPRTLVRVRRVARKNPLTKVLIGGVINLIPFIAIFNLLFVWVYLAYRDEKASYKNAREAAEEALAQASSDIA